MSNNEVMRFVEYILQVLARTYSLYRTCLLAYLLDNESCNRNSKDLWWEYIRCPGRNRDFCALHTHDRYDIPIPSFRDGREPYIKFHS